MKSSILLKITSILLLLAAAVMFSSCNGMFSDDEVGRNLEGEYAFVYEGALAVLTIQGGEATFEYETTTVPVITAQFSKENTYEINSYRYIGTYSFDEVNDTIVFNVESGFHKLRYEGDYADKVQQYFISMYEKWLDKKDEKSVSKGQMMLEMIRDGKEVSESEDDLREIDVRIAFFSSKINEAVMSKLCLVYGEDEKIRMKAFVDRNKNTVEKEFYDEGGSVMQRDLIQYYADALICYQETRSFTTDSGMVISEDMYKKSGGQEIFTRDDYDETGFLLRSETTANGVRKYLKEWDAAMHGYWQEGIR